MFSFVAFIASLLVFVPAPAGAYLDPGTGSYITQVLVASFLGALYALKLSWSRIKLFFTSKSSARSARGEQPDKQ